MVDADMVAPSKQRGDAAGRDDGHGSTPHSPFMTRDEPLDQGDIAPEDPRLHGADGVPCPGILLRCRLLDSHPRQLCRRRVESLHGQVDARAKSPRPRTPPSSATITSKVVAVPLSMTISGPRIDHMCAPMALTRRSAPASEGLSMRTWGCRASAFSPITRGSTLQIPAADRLRRLKIDCGTTLEMMHRESMSVRKLRCPAMDEQLKKPDGVLVGRAAGIGRRRATERSTPAPSCTWRIGCWCCPVQWREASRASEEYIAGRDPPDPAVIQPKPQSPVAVQALGNALDRLGSEARDAGLAQAMGAGRPGVGDGGKA